jgi:hypothetical protein
MYTTALTSAQIYGGVYNNVLSAEQIRCFVTRQARVLQVGLLSPQHGFLSKSGLSGNSGIVSNAASTFRAVLPNLGLNMAKFGLRTGNMHFDTQTE